MEIKQIQKISVKNNSTILDCLKKINETGYGSLLVVQNKLKLIGIITDGDIRRALLKKISLSSNIKNIYNSSPLKITKNLSFQKIKSIMKKENISLIPKVNSVNNVMDVFTIRDFSIKDNSLSTPVIIMAGGKGIRMKPFTHILPKALLPFNNSTIIEEIIKNFEINEFKKIIISTGFKSNILKKHLGKNKNLYFSKEKKPLGTVGGIKLLSKKIKDNFILCNCDTLIDANIKDLIDFHKKNKNFITVVCAISNEEIKYGICKINKSGHLKNILEKPNFQHLLNTGFYILNKNCIPMIPKNKKYDINELIFSCIRKKKKIGVYPISIGQWKDVGNWKDYYRHSQFNN